MIPFQAHGDQGPLPVSAEIDLPPALVPHRQPTNEIDLGGRSGRADDRRARKASLREAD